MRSAIMVSVLVLASACGSPDPGLAPTTIEQAETARFEYFETALADFAADDGIAGLSYAIVDSGGVLASDGIGFADIARARHVDQDTLFHIGSTHKAMNAALVAVLVDEGLLEWDTPVAEVLPGSAIDPAILVRHLLTMTAGIPADLEDELDEPWDQDQAAQVIIEAVADAELLAEPGDAFDYSNVSASLAGYVAAAAVGDPRENLHQVYVDLFVDRLLNPLGTEDATLLISEALASGRYSLAYELEGSDFVVVDSSDADVDLLAPSGSLKSSVNHMALFLQMLLNGGRSRQGRDVISEESLDVLWEPALENYAMGWEEVVGDGDTTYLSHEGAFDGYLSLIMIVPDSDLGLVILTNSEDAAANLIAAAPQLLLDVGR